MSESLKPLTSLQGKKDFADAIELILRWKHPGLSGWVQYYHKSPCKVKACQESQRMRCAGRSRGQSCAVGGWIQGM